MQTVAHPDVSHYTYRVTWSAEDGEFLATCAEFPSLSWLASSQIGALQGLESLHRELAIHAAEDGMSLNQYVLRKLAAPAGSKGQAS